MTEFIRERRYIVLKISDCEMALSPQQVKNLNGILTSINKTRKQRGKDELQCVVVENDWPEYETTFKAIEKRVIEGE